MRLQEEKSWYGGVADFLRMASQSVDIEADAKEFEQIGKYIEEREYQKVLDLCMKYGELEKEVSSAGFVKQSKESKQNPLKGFCQYVVGRLYENVAGDNEKAFEYYDCSMNNGCVYALLRYAEIMAVNEEDEEKRHEGLKAIKECALDGHPMAVVKYAQLLLEGAETKAQKNYAYELLKIADGYGDQEKHFLDEHQLYYLIGKCNEEGIGTTQSEKTAMIAYKFSLQCYPPNEFYGNVETCMDICRKMIEKDTAGETVYNVLRQLSALGYLDAVMLVIDTYIKTGDRKCEQVVEDVAKVALAYEGLAETEKGRVFWALSCYYMGNDDDKALSNLMKSSSLKNSDAVLRMACCFANGSLGLAQDDDQAYKMFSQVTEMEGVDDNTLAQTYKLCATVIRRNIGKKLWAKDTSMVECYKRAMKFGDAEAMTEIALLTLNDVCDTGLSKDDVKDMVEKFMESNAGNESDADVMFNLAKIYSTPIFGVDLERILDILDDALIISDDDAEILDYKGSLLLSLERENEANDVWEQLVGIAPEYVEAMKETSEFVKRMLEENAEQQ